MGVGEPGTRGEAASLSGENCLAGSFVLTSCAERERMVAVPDLTPMKDAAVRVVDKPVTSASGVRGSQDGLKDRARASRGEAGAIRGLESRTVARAAYWLYTSICCCRYSILER